MRAQRLYFACSNSKFTPRLGLRSGTAPPAFESHVERLRGVAAAPVAQSPCIQENRPQWLLCCLNRLDARWRAPQSLANRGGRAIAPTERSSAPLGLSIPRRSLQGY